MCLGGFDKPITSNLHRPTFDRPHLFATHLKPVYSEDKGEACRSIILLCQLLTILELSLSCS